MQALDHSQRFAADLYRLAYLLTGRGAMSVDVALEALELEGGPSPFFSSWMEGWSRRIVIAKALAAIRKELAASARRTASRRLERLGLPARTWSLDGSTTAGELERALLAIDVFPRCALLLSTFEGLSLEDAVILLDAPRELVRQAQIIGLRELTRNLARAQGWIAPAAEPYLITGEMQHA